jgi:hypothetical protein
MENALTLTGIAVTAFVMRRMLIGGPLKGTLKMGK